MRYVIDGCYGDGNVGDECLLQAVVERIRCVDEAAEIAVFSADPAETTAETGLRGIQQCNPFGRNLYGSLVKGQMWRTIDEIRRADVFVLGGGELFRDNVGPTATLGMFYRMRLARWLGKRVLVLGVGAQPATTRWGSRVLGSALHDAHSILFRDEDSLRVAGQLAPGLSAASCSPDLVFSLDWSPFRRQPIRDVNTRDPLRIGVAVKSLPAGHDCYGDVHDQLPAKLTETLLSISQGRSCQIDVLPFATADVAQADRLSQRLRAAGLCVAPPTAPQVAPLQRTISQLDCLLAVPLHASVFAFACGIPAIGLAYDAKIPRLYQTFGMEEYCLSVRDLQTSRMERQLRRLLERRDLVSDRLAVATRRANQQVCDDVDGRLRAAVDIPSHAELRTTLQPRSAH